MHIDRRSNKLVFYNILSTVLLYAITFISAPIFSRLLGTENYGIVQVYNTWLSIISAVIGLGTHGTISLASVYFDEKERDAYQSSAMALSLLGFLLVSVFLIGGYGFFLPILKMDFWFLILLPIHAFASFATSFLNARFVYELKAKYNLLISVFSALANLGLSVLLVMLMPNQMQSARILGGALPTIVLGMAAICYVLKKGKMFYSARYWKYCLPLSLPIVIHSLASVINGMIDRTMISNMIDFSSTGIYSLAYNFAGIMSNIWTAFNNSWTPFFLEYMKNNEFETLLYRSKSYMRLYTGLTVGFLLLAPEVYKLFASQSYWEGVNVIPLVVGGAYAVYVYSFATNYEFALQKTKMIAAGTVIAAMVNIIANSILIPRMGYLGAAIATLISDITLACVHMIFAIHIAKEKWVYDVKFFLVGILQVIVAIGMFYFVDTWFIRWAVGAVVGVYIMIPIIKKRTLF